MPKAIVDARRGHGLPLFEVPYEMPFIAITERAAARLVNEQFGVLERGAHVHERLERLVIEGHGLDEILASTGAAIGGAAIVLDAAGRELARSAGGRRPTRRGDAALAAEIAAQAPARGAGPVRARARRARRPGARRARSRAAAAARRSPGSRWSPSASRSATSSASALARRRSSSGSS